MNKTTWKRIDVENWVKVSTFNKNWIFGKIYVVGNLYEVEFMGKIYGRYESIFNAGAKVDELTNDLLFALTEYSEEE